MFSLRCISSRSIFFVNNVIYFDYLNEIKRNTNILWVICPQWHHNLSHPSYEIAAQARNDTTTYPIFITRFPRFAFNDTKGPGPIFPYDFTLWIAAQARNDLKVWLTPCDRNNTLSPPFSLRNSCVLLTMTWRWDCHASLAMTWSESVALRPKRQSESIPLPYEIAATFRLICVRKRTSCVTLSNTKTAYISDSVLLSLYFNWHIFCRFIGD